MTTNLKNELIRLAHEKPELREHLLPIIKEAKLRNPVGIGSHSDTLIRLSVLLKRVRAGQREMDALKQLLLTAIKEVDDTVMYIDQSTFDGIETSIERLSQRSGILDDVRESLDDLAKELGTGKHNWRGRN